MISMKNLEAYLTCHWVGNHSPQADSGITKFAHLFFRAIQLNPKPPKICEIYLFLRSLKLETSNLCTDFGSRLPKTTFRSIFGRFVGREAPLKFWAP